MVLRIYKTFKIESRNIMMVLLFRQNVYVNNFLNEGVKFTVGFSPG